MNFSSVLLATLLASFSRGQPAQQINIKDRHFVTEDQRQVLFHGVNVVYKVDPYLPSTEGAFDAHDSLNDQDI